MLKYICMVTNVSREWGKSQYRTSGQQWTNLTYLCNKWEMRDWKLPSAVLQSEVTSREISGLNMLLPVIYMSKCCLNLHLSLLTMKVSNPNSSTFFSSSRQTFNIKQFLYFICWVEENCDSSAKKCEGENWSIIFIKKSGKRNGPHTHFPQETN